KYKVLCCVLSCVLRCKPIFNPIQIIISSKRMSSHINTAYYVNLGKRKTMQKPKQRLRNQTCIITGASSGIGKATAQCMGMEGANIVVNYLGNKEQAEEVAQWINANA